MGKASKWFRGLLGLRKPDSSSSTSFSSSQPPTTSKPPPKKKWSFVKSYREKEPLNKPVEISRSSVALGSSQATDDNDDPNKHAIAVAAATAAVAEAAVAAAQAAAEVVRLTSSGRAISSNAGTTTNTTARMTSFGSRNAGATAVHSSPAYFSGSLASYGNREDWAAVKIQSHFRAYLSRRALRALKALVKLQALVRGHIVRKKTAAYLRQMQALLRAQARASVGRAQIFESPHKSNHIHYPGPATPEKFEHIARAKSMKHGENIMFRRNGSKSTKVISNQDCRMDVKSWNHHEGLSVKTGSRDDERNDKILEVDTGKPQIMMHKRRNLFHSSHLSIGSDQCSHSFTTSKDSTAHQTVLSMSSCEVQAVSPLKFSQDIDDDDPFCTAENSPQFHSTSSKGGCSKRGPFTPTKSDGSRSCLSGYTDYPNYMSCTESSKAKTRSLSAPKQRPQFERSSSTKRFSIHGYGESRINPQRVSALHANFTSKAYPGSGRLDRLGMPVREEAMGYSGGHWHHF